MADSREEASGSMSTSDRVMQHPPTHDTTAGQACIPDLLPEDEWSRLVQGLGLSPREADILRCAFYDERSIVIAKCLGLSVNTVHTYRDRLFRKLRVRSMAQVISLAFAVFVQQRQAMRGHEGVSLQPAPTENPVMAP